MCLFIEKVRKCVTVKMIIRADDPAYEERFVALLEGNHSGDDTTLEAKLREMMKVENSNT